MFKSSDRLAFLDTQLSIQDRHFKKPGQIFLKSAVLAGIHVTVLYNFPYSPWKNSHLKEKQLMSFAYGFVYDFSVYFW